MARTKIDPTLFNLTPAVTAQTTSGTTTTSTTFVDTSLTATITPSSAAHRIKVSFICGVGANATGQGGYLGIKRTSTDLYSEASTPWRFYAFNNTAQAQFSLSGEIIDSPATASAVTYTLRLGAISGSTVLIGGALNTGMNIVMKLEEIL